MKKKKSLLCCNLRLGRLQWMFWPKTWCCCAVLRQIGLLDTDCPRTNSMEPCYFFLVLLLKKNNQNPKTNKGLWLPWALESTSKN